MMQLAFWDSDTSDTAQGPPVTVRGRRFLRDRNSGTSLQLVLASGSPGKYSVLRQLGLRFIVDPADVDEQSLLARLPPPDGVKKLALAKATSIADRHFGRVILGADTVVLRQGDQVVGKPLDKEDAFRTLSALSGTTHMVLSGLALIDTRTGTCATVHVVTTVVFKRLTEETVNRYVRSGEPMGKAGSYSLQQAGALLIERIEGDPHNVMGLPVTGFSKALDELGIEVL